MLKVNDYFSGKVKSIGFDAASTGRASVGVMEAGEYTFTTGQPEEMTVISGALKTLLPGANDWRFLCRERLSTCRHTANSACSWRKPAAICASI